MTAASVVQVPRGSFAPTVRRTRPPVHTTSAKRRPLGSAGSALIEALAALTLVAIAGSVVAAAAATNLRATRQAAMLESLVAVGARELAVAEARGAPVATEESPIDVPGAAGTTRRLVVTHAPSGIATLEVRLTAPGTPPLQLATRMLLSE